MAFEKGDIVYIAEEHRFTHDTGIDFDGPLTVLSSDATWTKVEGPNTRGYREVFTYRFEKRGTRVEGYEIKAGDIRVGDAIRFEYDHADLKVTREGVVRKINNSAGHHVYTAESMKINYQPSAACVNQKYILVKAAPEVDEVLERVKAAGKDKLVEITREDGFRVAKKHTSIWTVYAPEGWVYKNNEEFAEYIREADVVWHA